MSKDKQYKAHSIEHMTKIKLQFEVTQTHFQYQSAITKNIAILDERPTAQSWHTIQAPFKNGREMAK